MPAMKSRLSRVDQVAPPRKLTRGDRVRVINAAGVAILYPLPFKAGDRFTVRAASTDGTLVALQEVTPNYYYHASRFELVT